MVGPIASVFDTKLPSHTRQIMFQHLFTGMILLSTWMPFESDLKGFTFLLSGYKNPCAANDRYLSPMMMWFLVSISQISFVGFYWI